MSLEKIRMTISTFPHLIFIKKGTLTFTEYTFHLLSNEAISCQIVLSGPISHLGYNG